MKISFRPIVTKVEVKIESNSLAITSIECAAGYIAAMIDGEGFVSSNIRHKKVGISNTEQDIIDATRSCLDLLEITYKSYTQSSTGITKEGISYRDKTTIIINGLSNLQRLRALVPIKSIRKLTLLDKMIIAYKKTPSKELLYDLYINKQLSIPQISRKTKYSKTSIRRLLVEYNIKIRTIAEGNAIALANGRGGRERGSGLFYSADKKKL